MPVATRKSALVDRNGRAMNYGLYLSPRNNRAHRPRPVLSPDTRQNVTEYDRMDLVNLSTQLVAQVDILDTAVEQKNNWAFGDSWEPHFVGSSDDLAFAEEAKNFLNFQFYPNCNRRGRQFDMRTSMRLMGRAWDVAGDDLVILTETENHFPQFALYPATRVATYSRSKDSGIRDGDTLNGGPFDGAKIFDGVILNRDNRIIGVRLINDDGEHTDISEINADLAFEPKWCDGIRGIPRIAVSLLRWLSLQDTDQYIQDGVKRASKMAFKVKNTEGDAAVGNEVITDQDESPTASDSNNSVVGGMASERKLHYAEVAGGGGEILYHAEGEDIDYVKYENPHPNVEAFIERKERGALASVGWFHELLNLGEGGRAPSRLLCEVANQNITDRQSTGLRRWKRIITYALAKAAKHGFIRKPKDPRSFGRWEPGYPKQISVDAGNDIKASLDLIKFGLSTVSIEAAKLGYHVDFIRAAQQKELFGVVEDADRIFALVKSKGVTYQECLQMVRQTNPNPGNSQPQQADGSPSSGGGAKSHEVKISIDNKTDKPVAKRQMDLVRDATGKVTGLQER